MDGRKLVAWNLRRLRVQRDLSQEKLAVDAQVDRTYVSRLERRLENPTVAVLDRLADALSVHVSEFFAEPRPGLRPPNPLPGGRRSKTKRSKLL
jgi:transcriptional regulator with XRE-family HTH domain